MEILSNTFGLVLSNIPLMNLRTEFAYYYDSFVNDKFFLSQFTGRIKVIKTRYMIWVGMPDDLITIILQRVIGGLESYISGAVYIELGKRGKLKENIRLLKNPFELGRKGTVENLYHELPALVDIHFSLKKTDGELWKKTKAFYKEIRNPIFHGHNITTKNINALKNVFNYLAELYKWIDSWHDFSRIFDDSSTKNEPNRSRA